ncbi:MAG: GAF domain-containing protein [Deltaproteobacteria bacterium]|jgi:GAF domain-containing protein|nr:GAF domain-containing protein [Deltaproteobacteria bacterium]MBW2530927.1 GAF domain-containing protein [Deltaproteobacteria bacterium]
MTVLNAFLGVASESSEEKVLRLLIELGAQFVGAQEGSLLVLDDESAELVFAMTIGSDASEQSLIGQRVPLGEGLVGLAAQTHEVQIGAPRFDVPGAAEGKADQGKPQAVLAAPMLIGDRLIGVITAVSFDPDKRFGTADAMLYGRIATVAGVVVEQRRKLAAVEALQRGDTMPEAVSQEERTDREIVDSVQRLVRLNPAAKPQVARLLGVVESLLGG